MYKIGFDTSPLYNSNSVRGIGYYTQNLLGALKKNEKKYNVQIVELKTYQDRTNTKLDLFHQPYFDPFSLDFKRIQPKKIITIHDLIPIEFERYFPVGIRGRIKWLIQKHKALTYDTIITDSEYSKNSIIKILDINPNKVVSIPLAASSEYQPISKSLATKTIKSLNLPTKYILYTGDINWNKNIPNLAMACVKLSIPLVIVGKTAASQNIPNHPWTKDLQTIKQLQKAHPKLILTPGYLDTPTLNSVYNLATLYCQPSYAEGFGLGLLEAMQAGSPAIYSNQTSLPEVGGSKLISFDPNLHDEPYSTIKRVTANPKILEELSKTGIQQAKAFSWDTTARKTIETYLRAINQP